MTIKEKIKQEIDRLPDDLIEQVYNYIGNIKINKLKKGKLHTFQLKGKFDNMNIRVTANE